MWKVFLYTTGNGENPVGDFIKSLSKKEEAKLEIAKARMEDYLKRKGD